MIKQIPVEMLSLPVSFLSENVKVTEIDYIL